MSGRDRTSPDPGGDDVTGAMRSIVRSGGEGTQDEVLYRAWPARSPRAALLLLHGLGGHTDRYQECGRYWAGRGISTYALELPGFGYTKGPSGHVDTFETYHRQTETLFARIVAENSRRPVFLMGESMGGVLAVDFLLRRPALLSGLVLVAPSLRDRLNVSLALKLEALWNVVLGRRKYYDLPWDPSRFTRDPDVISFLERDEIEVRRVTGQFYFAYTPVANRARRGARFLRLPVLVQLPGEDLMIDSDYTRSYFERIEMDDRRLIEYPGHYHALLLDTGREQVFADAAEWILEHSGSPSLTKGKGAP